MLGEVSCTWGRPGTQENCVEPGGQTVVGSRLLSVRGPPGSRNLQEELWSWYSSSRSREEKVKEWQETEDRTYCEDVLAGGRRERRLDSKCVRVLCLRLPPCSALSFLQGTCAFHYKLLVLLPTCLPRSPYYHQWHILIMATHPRCPLQSAARSPTCTPSLTPAFPPQKMCSHLTWRAC
jgi:hypothetical protein